jgi:hypothetical protein
LERKNCGDISTSYLGIYPHWGKDKEKIYDLFLMA